MNSFWRDVLCFDELLEDGESVSLVVGVWRLREVLDESKYVTNGLGSKSRPRIFLHLFQSFSKALGKRLDKVRKDAVIRIEHCRNYAPDCFEVLSRVGKGRKRSNEGIENVMGWNSTECQELVEQLGATFEIGNGQNVACEIIQCRFRSASLRVLRDTDNVLLLQPSCFRPRSSSRTILATAVASGLRR